MIWPMIWLEGVIKAGKLGNDIASVGISQRIYFSGDRRIVQT